MIICDLCKKEVHSVRARGLDGDIPMNLYLAWLRGNRDDRHTWSLHTKKSKVPTIWVCDVCDTEITNKSIIKIGNSIRRG